MTIKYRKHNEHDVLGYEFKSEIKSLDDNTIEMIGSTEVKDRDDEVVKIEAWDIKNFNKNPVVLLNHNHYDLPIAKAKAKIEKKKLIFDIRFPSEEEGGTEKSETVRKLYKSGYMKASSVGFLPKEWTTGKKDTDPVRTFTDVELLEISLVTVPSNPQAMISAKNMKDAISSGELDENIVKDILGLPKDNTPDINIKKAVEAFFNKNLNNFVEICLQKIEEKIIKDENSRLFEKFLAGEEENTSNLSLSKEQIKQEIKEFFSKI